MKIFGKIYDEVEKSPELYIAILILIFLNYFQLWFFINQRQNYRALTESYETEINRISKERDYYESKSIEAKSQFDDFKNEIRECRRAYDQLKHTKFFEDK